IKEDVHSQIITVKKELLELPEVDLNIKCDISAHPNDTTTNSTIIDDNSQLNTHRLSDESHSQCDNVDNSLRNVARQEGKSESETKNMRKKLPEEEQNTRYTLRKRKDLQPPIHLKDFKLNLVDIDIPTTYDEVINCADSAN
ncbi:hypothetical protein ILUMI_19303, partial [Ignelater luminosus]